MFAFMVYVSETAFQIVLLLCVLLLIGAVVADKLVYSRLSRMIESTRIS